MVAQHLENMREQQDKVDFTLDYSKDLCQSATINIKDKPFGKLVQEDGKINFIQLSGAGQTYRGTNPVKFNGNFDYGSIECFAKEPKAISKNELGHVQIDGSKVLETFSPRTKRLIKSQKAEYALVALHQALIIQSFATWLKICLW